MKARAARSASAVTLQVLTTTTSAVGRSFAETRRAQPLADRFAIGARGAAPEILDMESSATRLSLGPDRSESGFTRRETTKMTFDILEFDHFASKINPLGLRKMAAPRTWNAGGATLCRSCGHAPDPHLHLLHLVCYLSIGLPLAILPAYVHLRMGFSAVLAGLVISVQYIATFLSRPWAGRISDRQGAKVSVLWGMGACTASGLLLLAAVALHFSPWLSFLSLIASRLALGVGESLGSTGATLWGISAAGPENTAKVISYNGVSTYGGLALGAPLGVVMEKYWGLSSVGLLTIAICGISFAIAARKMRFRLSPGNICPSVMCWDVWRRMALGWRWQGWAIACWPRL